MTDQGVIDAIDEAIEYLGLMLISGGEDSGETPLIAKLERAEELLRRRYR